MYVYVYVCVLVNKIVKSKIYTGMPKIKNSHDNRIDNKLQRFTLVDTKTYANN